MKLSLILLFALALSACKEEKDISGLKNKVSSEKIKLHVTDSAIDGLNLKVAIAESKEISKGYVCISKVAEKCEYRISFSDPKKNVNNIIILNVVLQAKIYLIKTQKLFIKIIYNIPEENQPISRSVVLTKK